MTNAQLYAKANRCRVRSADLSDQARRCRLSGQFAKGAELEKKALEKTREANRLYLESKK